MKTKKITKKQKEIFLKTKKMTKKQRETFEYYAQQRVNSDLQWMLGAVQHELDLSNDCIANGEERRQ